MDVKTSFSDYSRTVFLELINRIKNDEVSIPIQIGLIIHFTKVIGHPAGADLIYCPEDGADDSPEGITKTIEEWRAANGLPGFKK